MITVFKIELTPPSHEEAEERNKKLYKVAQSTPENMSYWFPKIEIGQMTSSSILLPKTKIVQLERERWKWLRSDDYKEGAIKEFSDYLASELGDFEEDYPLFMKTGIFSNKFEFGTTRINTPEEVGEKFLSMYYTSLVFGADMTAEVVLRELIEDKENRQTIYEGMPLHTEYRVFYDFDEHKTVGVANYWHPELMENNLREEDLSAYLKEKDRLVGDYKEHKSKVIAELEEFLHPVTDLAGKWSVDVMKNGDDLWLIDMARMDRSALLGQIEEV